MTDPAQMEVKMIGGLFGRRKMREVSVLRFQHKRVRKSDLNKIGTLN